MNVFLTQFLAYPLFLADPTMKVDEFTEEAKAISDLIIAIVNAGLIVLSAIVLLLIIVAAVEYMKADEPQFRTQKKQYIQGILTMYVTVFVIVVVICLTAESLVLWIINLTHIQFNTPGTTTTTGG